ncbi:hypothetical protein KO317_00145 [Candidatus Micrarchaeota archaeon]|nr:hypothetical protein [Candidatus Micrarchaeota archaeon]
MCTDIRRKKKDPLTSIKNQNWIRKKFGEIGIKVYISIKTSVSFEKLIKETGTTKEQLLEMLQIMEKKDIIEIQGTLDLPIDQPEPIVTKEEVEDIKKSISQNIEENHKKPEETELVLKDATETRGEEIIREEPTEIVKQNRKPPVYPAEEEIKEEPKIKPKEPPKPPEKPKKEEQNLSPIEKIIFDKYGDSGVNVYNLIDGQRTAEEILRKTGVTEVKLIEILEFLDKQGIIKLEKPSKEKHLKKLSPLTEYELEGVEPEADDKNIIPIDIPVKSKLNFSQKLRIGPEIALKFGSDGTKVFDLIDGERTVIDLAVELNMKLIKIDELMEFLAIRDAALFKSMDREQIRYKYGDEGFAIYKKYGREGVYVYELIGRVPSFKDIVKITGIDPHLVVEVFIFIHNVLDIELPLTKQMMYSQLGIS